MYNRIPQRPPQDITECHLLGALYQEARILPSYESGTISTCPTVLLRQCIPSWVEREQVSLWLKVDIDDKDGNVRQYKGGNVPIEAIEICKTEYSCC